MIDTYLEGIIQCLSTCPVVSAFNVTREEVGEEDGYIRIKCNLSNGDTLEFAEYVERKLREYGGEMRMAKDAGLLIAAKA